jgi:hypothetical protein
VIFVVEEKKDFNLDKWWSEMQQTALYMKDVKDDGTEMPVDAQALQVYLFHYCFIIFTLLTGTEI